MDLPAGAPRVSVKAVLLGDSGVGKTSLARRWTTGLFHQTPTTTVGANHHKKRMLVDGEQVDVFLWDTAGQEQYQALTPLYVRSAAVGIIVAVINDAATFDHIRDWVALLAAATDVTPPIVLAVNKVDAVGEPAPREEAIQAEYQARFSGLFFVSAVTNEGVDNLFAFAAQTGYAFVKSGPGVQPQPVARAGGRADCC
jgi:small GTP-binding protein